MRRRIASSTGRTGAPAVAVLAAAAAVLLWVVQVDGAGAQADGDDAGADKQTIATVTSNGLRVQLVAFREESDGPPRATVRIAAFRRAGGEWLRLGRPQVVGGERAWFWNVVTARFGVRQLGIRMPGGLFPLQVGVRLLQSASLGPGARFLFSVEDGRLVPIDV